MRMTSKDSRSEFEHAGEGDVQNPRRIPDRRTGRQHEEVRGNASRALARVVRDRVLHPRGAVHPEEPVLRRPPESASTIAVLRPSARK